MRNITLSADEHLIEPARLLAKSQHKTLNALFRDWLRQFTAQDGGGREFDVADEKAEACQAGRRFNRDECLAVPDTRRRRFLYVLARLDQRRRPGRGFGHRSQAAIESPILQVRVNYCCLGRLSPPSSPKQPDHCGDRFERYQAV